MTPPAPCPACGGRYHWRRPLSRAWRCWRCTPPARLAAVAGTALAPGPDPTTPEDEPMPKTPTLGQSTPAALAKQQAATEALTEAEALARAALAVARHVGGGDCHPARARRLATALGRARRAVEVALVQVDHLPPRPRARRAPADAAPAE